MTNVEKALSNIGKHYPVVAAVLADGGRTLIVVMDSQVTSRARRVEEVREAMGRAGRGIDLRVYTPGELMEFKAMDSPERPDLSAGTVVSGSVERFL